METLELQRYTVVNDQGEFLETDNLLLLPVWTRDVHQMWLTASQVEAHKVAGQAQGTACRLQLRALAEDPAATKQRGIPVAVQQQIVSLRAQNYSYRQIAALLNISKSTVGNILNR